MRKNKGIEEIVRWIMDENREGERWMNELKRLSNERVNRLI